MVKIADKKKKHLIFCDNHTQECAHYNEIEVLHITRKIKYIRYIHERTLQRDPFQSAMKHIRVSDTVDLINLIQVSAWGVLYQLSCLYQDKPRIHPSWCFGESK